MGADAAAAWRAMLADLAIPDDLIRRAPETPYGFPRELFRRSASLSLKRRTGPSFERASEALRPSGTVLDVGVGGGAASLPLAPFATRITGVDESPEQLESFREAADAMGVVHGEVEGTWPDVAPVVDVADVVVCHHVFYNVPRLDAFARALTEKARRRVVVEITERHPMTSLNDLWMRFHGLRRPDAPTAQDALAVLRATGIDPNVEWSSSPSLWGTGDPAYVAFVRRRLCLTPDRDAEIAEALRERPDEPRRTVTLWWPP